MEFDIGLTYGNVFILPAIVIYYTNNELEFKIGIGIAWIYFAATMEYYKPKNEINGI